jgi:hypothetical protein
VPGIGKVRANRIAQAWADQKVVREIMVFLHSHGVGTARAVRIFKTYGNNAVQVMAENPYRLARDIRGIGFRTTDAIAARLGIEPAAMIRLRAGINYALLEASGEGHCGLPTAELLKLAGELLAVERPPVEQGEGNDASRRDPLEPALMQTALDLELSEGSVVADSLGCEPAMVLAVAALFDCKTTLHQRLRLRQAVGGLQQRSQVVEINGHPGMIRPIAGLIDRQGTHIERLRVRIRRLALQQQTKLVQESARRLWDPRSIRKPSHRLGMGRQGIQHRPAAYILGIAHKGPIEPAQGSF